MYGIQLGLPMSILMEIADPRGFIMGPLTQAFANFRPLPGSTMVRYQVAEYPFYTQQIAANASIKQPNAISMLMYCPASPVVTLTYKLAIMSALQATLDYHIQAGGTFTVITPALIYTDCLLVGVTDVSTEQTNQPQWAYQFDFMQPLLTFDSSAPQKFNSVLGGMTGSKS
jgi:hypothetical protein